MKNKLILLMIDAVSADYYRTEWGRLPNLRSLETRGFRINSLHAEVLGTSLPGRASIVTGMPAHINGVYANKIWDPGRRIFRYANPDDLRVPTLHALAKDAGRNVANIGLGMIRPEEAHIFKAPWWASAFMQRARDTEQQAADPSWMRVASHRTEEAFTASCNAAGVPDELPKIDMKDEAQHAFFGLMGDHAMFDWAGVLATGPEAPDLISAEFLVTDTIQHHFGYKSDLSHWAVMQADLAVGKILSRLRAAGVEEEWNIAVMSDHGHSPIDHALHPRVIIPEVMFQCEGQIMLTAPKDDAEAAENRRRLANHGVDQFSDACLPPDVRGQVQLYIAPDGHSFEDSKADAEPIGAPRSVSSHGLRPGLPGDDRFAVLAGPDVPRGGTEEADAVQMMPTLAKLIGITVDAGAPPFF